MVEIEPLSNDPSELRDDLKKKNVARKRARKWRLQSSRTPLMVAPSLYLPCLRREEY